MVVEVVNAEGILRATVDSYGDPSQCLLLIHRSVLCGQQDPLFASVVDVLNACCTELVEAYEVEDNTVIYGRRRSSISKVFRECPGCGVPHRCRTADGFDEELEQHVRKRDAEAA